MTIQQLFTAIYNSCFKDGAVVVTGKGGSMEQYRECFQEVLVQFYKRLIHADTVLPPTGSLTDCKFVLSRKGKESISIFGKPCLYLYRAVANLFFMDKRRTGKIRQMEDGDLTEWEDPWEEPDLPDYISDYLDNLNPVQKDILFYFYWENMPIHDISEILKQKHAAKEAAYSPDYVRQEKFRIIQRLKKLKNPTT